MDKDSRLITELYQRHVSGQPTRVTLFFSTSEADEDTEESGVADECDYAFQKI